MTAAAANPWVQPVDVGAGVAEWSTWYGDYLNRTARQSAHSLELYRQVLDAVARGDLPATAIEDKLPSFVQSRFQPYLQQLTERSTRFFTGLVQIASAYSQDLAASVMPDISVRPVVTPRFNSTDPAVWFQQLADYANQLSANALRAYQVLAERLAAGALSLDTVQQHSADMMQRRLPEHLRRLGTLYFELLNGLADLQATYQEAFLSDVLASMQQGELTLDLTAPLGETASVSIVLTNTHDTPSTIRYSLGDIRRVDGIGPAFVPLVTFDPAQLDLGPGEEARVLLSVHLDDEHYDADAVYAGSLYIAGQGDPGFTLPLRVQATRAPAPPTGKAGPAEAGQENA